MYKSFKGQTYRQQQHRIDLSISFIRSFGSEAVGFRPPLLAYDQNTIDAMRHFQMLYINCDDSPDRSYPRNLYYKPVYPEGGRLTLFPKSELNDYDLVYKFNINDRNRLVDIMFRDFSRIYDLHGLYKLNYSEQFLADPSLVNVPVEVINRIKDFNSSVWIAQAREISRWVQDRELLEIVTISNDSALVVKLENNNSESVNEIVLKLFAPIDSPAEFLTPTRTSRNCTFDVVDSAFFLYLPELKPGEIFTAELSKRGGIPLNASSKKFLKTLFFGMIAVALMFVGWAVYYLVFTRKRKLVVGGERDDTGGEQYNFKTEITVEEVPLALVSDMFTLPGDPPSSNQPILKSLSSDREPSSSEIVNAAGLTAKSEVVIDDTSLDLLQPSFLMSNKNKTSKIDQTPTDKTKKTHIAVAEDVGVSLLDTLTIDRQKPGDSGSGSVMTLQDELDSLSRKGDKPTLSFNKNAAIKEIVKLGIENHKPVVKSKDKASTQISVETDFTPKKATGKGKSVKNQLSSEQLSRLRSLGHGVIGKPTRTGQSLKPGEKSVVTDMKAAPVPSQNFSSAAVHGNISDNNAAEIESDLNALNFNISITETQSRMRVTAPLPIDSNSNPERKPTSIQVGGRSSIELYNRSGKHVKSENIDWR